NACPEEAIAIEIVNISAWRRQHDSANAPGLPSAEDSLSTTRITVPAGLDAALSRVDTLRVQPEHPHWSLVLLLVATQLSVGSFLALFLTQLLESAPGPFAAVLPLLIGLTAIGAAPVHLGRPAFAYRAIANWKRSWLSREILALSLFAGAAVAYSAVLFLQLPYGTYAGAAAVVTGLVGVTSSARIYMVKARPAWNLPHTLLSFHLTALVLGARLVPVPAVAACASLLQIAVTLAKEKHMAAAEAFELTASAELLNQQLGRQYRLYLLLSFVAVALLPFNGMASLLAALAAEIGGRWLFFTSVVPKNVASTFLTPKGAAA
ncbi:MAG: dimethyl sulfoxide reductase anchor subunit, partial [Bryobacterales bacterium]|nr:dimethyl sulfoxide reductase anchor subunit [Bryobacterales bacterium]